MRKNMRIDWENQLLAASSRDSEQQEHEFLSLVDEVANNVDLEIARVLMKTYLAKPDFGTQDSVESVLATGTPEIVVRAVLEEMPRLTSEAPEWAVTLLGQELEHRPALLLAAMEVMPNEVKAAVTAVASDSEFLEFYANAKLLTPRSA